MHLHQGLRPNQNPRASTIQMVSESSGHKYIQTFFLLYFFRLFLKIENQNFNWNPNWNVNPNSNPAAPPPQEARKRTPLKQLMTWLDSMDVTGSGALDDQRCLPFMLSAPPAPGTRAQRDRCWIQRNTVLERSAELRGIRDPGFT